MTPTRRTFFASLAALAVAPKVMKPEPRSATAEMMEEWFSQPHIYVTARAQDDYNRHLAMHLEDLANGFDPDHSGYPHLDAANRIAWRRHVREHQLAMKHASGTRGIEDGLW